MGHRSLFAVTTILSLAVTGLPFAAGPAKAGDDQRRSAQISSSSSDQPYLRDGGAVRIAPVQQRRDRRNDDDALAPRGDARPVSGIERLTGDDVLEGLREDDLGTAPDIYVTGEREEFLEDGGSIEPAFARGDAIPDNGIVVLRGNNTAGHWRHMVVRPVNLTSRGSFGFITSDVGTEPGNRGSYLPASARGFRDISSTRTLPSEPKIISVEDQRLDRRPMPVSGIETIYTGGAKIIRIAAGYQASANPVGDK
ncbi:hypothetical protein [Aurantimonas sp. 22II-16-19i]|uniref:hypothetical protein n=1 Tax=Aurantimonas sp. 22II-16-19i TaxID=1317114 RepID=UPI0009F7BBDF|nr:hypothetical protein [Aurantimonas sp. 22II-16-19i]ORE98553.1 hypothetical protein ATO4_03525 [Aurantimonas sp. 22II-16-19i]